MSDNMILLQELADDRTRERLAEAERRRLSKWAGGARQASTGGTRRAVGRALIRVGARLDGERWEPAATLPTGMLKAAR